MERAKAICRLLIDMFGPSFRTRVPRGRWNLSASILVVSLELYMKEFVSQEVSLY
jgi:hypothetical protein